MRLSEFLGGALDVGTHVLELVVDTFLQFQLLQVDGVVGVIRHFLVVVLFPGERLRPLDANLDAVVLDDAGEIARQSTLGDELFDGLFHLRTQGFERFFGLVTCHLRSEKLVDYFKISFRHITSPDGGIRFSHRERMPFSGKAVQK